MSARTPFTPVHGNIATELTMLHRLPVYFLDYVCVIVIYVSVAFWLAVLIDGILLPPYDEGQTRRTSTWVLYLQFVLQFAIQGFVVILINALLQLIPSPLDGVYGYNARGTIGSLVIRNPAIVTVVLFVLSPGLQGRLRNLYSRFNKNVADGRASVGH